VLINLAHKTASWYAVRWVGCCRLWAAIVH